MRRARRLLPASMLVLLVSLGLTMTILPVSLRLENLREIVAGVVYVQNWLLAGNAVDYLAASNAPTLVQHFWSLSAEEQFYFAWPILLLAAFSLGGRRRRAVILILVVLVTSSLAASSLMLATAPGQAYFNTFSRAWEFAAGGLLCFVPQLAGSKRRAAVAWFGLGLVGGAALLFGESTPFPGPAALLPVVGTAAVIIAGDPPVRLAPSVVARLRPVQYLGEISYSVYLWHFPVIQAYVGTRGHQPGGLSAVAVIALTIVLAALTKRFVEDRFRGAGSLLVRPSGRSTLIAVAAAIACVVAASTFSAAQVGAQNERAAAVALARIEHGDPCYSIAATVPGHACDNPFALISELDTSQVAADSTHLWCLEPYVGTTVKTCHYGDTAHPARRIALMGDSHANVLIDGLATVASARHWEIQTFMKEGCPAVPAPPLQGHLSEQDAIDCSRWSSSALRAIADDPSLDTVLFTNASNARG